MYFGQVIFLFFFLIILTVVLYFRRDDLPFLYVFGGKLIPNLFFILGCGYQPDGVQAGIYLLFFTLFPSFPLLVGILFVLKENTMKLAWTNNGRNMLVTIIQ
jgi:NADH-ubiquinone oxidoreductase chain 4